MLLLDTHTWLWWTSAPEQLSNAQRNALQDASAGTLAISAICCWEVAKLVERGRLVRDRPVLDWVRRATDAVHILPISPEVAVRSTQLPDGFHRDPADQIIVATALEQQIPLVTSDAKSLAYRHVPTIA